ncbi:MAG: M42 family metallopeptidase [bacterium]|nr:M42 family metallopeptidase [bacterium]
MQAAQIKYLEALLNAPSPSGYEDQAREVWRREMRTIADRVYGDTHGNSFAVLNENGMPRVMLAGHIDEIGFQVSYISEEGYVGFRALGGFDEQIVPGRRVVIHTAHGPVKGVIGKKAIHLMKKEERDRKLSLDDLWIDIGVENGKKARKLVEVGDAITYAEGFEHLTGDVYIGRGVDDRIGAFVVGEVLRYLKGRRFSAAVYAVATVQEEIGLRGAHTSTFGVNPDVGFAVDVTHAMSADTNKKLLGDIRLGKGPVVSRGPNFNPKLYAQIMSVAKAKKIAVQVEAAPRGTGTDANVMQLTRAGVATALVSVPNRYMHTPVEMFNLTDVAQAIKLIAETILSFTAKTDFVI